MTRELMPGQSQQPDAMRADPQTLTEIAALNARFAWLIDHHSGVGVPELFESDGVYGYLNGGKLVGRAAIGGFYDQRRLRLHRRSRHVFTNLVLTDIGRRKARGVTILTLFASEHPVTEDPRPILIADYHDCYVWSENLGWHYRSRHVDPVFGTPPTLGGVSA